MKIALVYRLAEIARSIISRMPPITTYPVANVVGDVVYYFWPGDGGI